MTKKELINELELLKLQNEILKKRLSFECCMLDNVSAEYHSLSIIIRKLEKENKHLKFLLLTSGEGLKKNL